MMKLFVALFAISATISSCSFIQEKLGGSSEKRTLTTEMDKVSYSIGYNMGKNFRIQNVEVDIAALLAGVNDGKTAATPILTEADQATTMRAFQTSHMKKQNEKRTETGKTNKTLGAQFLAENKTKKGVITTASGLQYKIITEGKGAKPAATDTVVTHYKGTLVDGTEFDSSYARKEPATFPVNGVIPGWTEALQLMSIGSKYQLFIPSALAYGERGSGQKVGPNSMLLFEVELLEIKPARQKSAKKSTAKKAKK
jgi:FKBP-type peptidyl-prolyl cis-trans isomerase FklB